MNNFTLSIITLVVGILFVLVFYIKMKKERREKDRLEFLTFDGLLIKIKQGLSDLAKDENITGASSDDEWETLYRKKTRIITALKDCIYGIDSAKSIVKGLISNMIKKLLSDEESILLCYNFKADFLESNVKFEIMLNELKKVHKTKALHYLVKKYNWDEARYIIEDKTQKSYAITDKDIDIAYKMEGIELTYEVMVEVLTTLVYQKYKGFGIIDTIREMDINGINGGASGSVLYNVGGKSKNSNIVKAPRSIWVQLEGRYIHFRFLTFKTEAEIKRVTLLLCKWGNPGPLTEKRGFIVGTMYDQSRCVVMRPPFAEYYAFFIRKFTLDDNSLDYLLNPKITQMQDDGVTPELDENGEVVKIPKYNNVDLVQKTIMYLIMCKVTCSFTGRQSAGKSTMMRACIKFMDPTLPLRVMEMTFELYLREYYSERSILTWQETAHNSIVDAQDVSKKTDAAIVLVGEVATAAITARMVQTGLLNSQCTYFSHHGANLNKTVNALANDYAADQKVPIFVAIQLILDVLKVDIHCDFDDYGRYIDNISQVVPLDTTIPYPDYDPKDPVRSKYELDKEFYSRKTDRKMFTTKEIIRFNRKTRTYEVAEGWFTNELTEYMLKSIPENKMSEFKKFIRDEFVSVLLDREKSDKLVSNA